MAAVALGLLSVVALECGAYYSCRHTYEATLIAELATAGVGGAVCAHPGLVHTPGHSGRLEGLTLLDPLYAMQVVPDVRIVRSESTAGIARAALAILASRGDDGQNGGAWEGSEAWDVASRGSLAIHALVPDMCKGAPKPRMLARAERVAEIVRDGMRKRHQFARPCGGQEATAHGAADGAAASAAAISGGSDAGWLEGVAGGDVTGGAADTASPGARRGERWLEETARGAAGAASPGAARSDERWLLQLLLLEPDALAISLCRCQAVGPAHSCWPNWRRPFGLANDALAPSSVIGAMPSSAYRKLLEALDCMEAAPTSEQTAVDLGASPGSWTAALRRQGCNVIAVDRSSLDRSLMEDPRVTFVEVRPPSV
jgi:hypothetical protein